MAEERAAGRSGLAPNRPSIERWQPSNIREVLETARLLCPKGAADGPGRAHRAHGRRLSTIPLERGTESHWAATS